MLYWLIVILGVIDIEAFDIELEVDTDVDVDVNGLASVLSFFNIGDMPLMVFLTFFSFPLWFVTLVANDILGTNTFVLGWLVLIPAIVASLLMAKILTIPVAKFYKKVKGNTEAIDDIVGRVCQAKLPISMERNGQAEIKVNGTSVLINAKTRKGITIAKGESALIIEFNAKQNYYYVEPYSL